MNDNFRVLLPAHSQIMHFQCVAQPVHSRLHWPHTLSCASEVRVHLNVFRKLGILEQNNRSGSQFSRAIFTARHVFVDGRCPCPWPATGSMLSVSSRAATEDSLVVASRSGLWAQKARKRDILGSCGITTGLSCAPQLHRDLQITLLPQTASS